MLCKVSAQCIFARRDQAFNIPCVFDMPDIDQVSVTMTLLSMFWISDQSLPFLKDF